MEVPNGGEVLEAKNDVVGVVTANLLRMQEEFNAFRQTSQEMQDFDSRMRMLIDDARNEVLKLRQEESETEICSLVAENTQQKILNDFLESEEALDVEVVRSQERIKFGGYFSAYKISGIESEAVDAEVVRSVPSPAGSNLEDVRLPGLEELSQHEEICLKSLRVVDQGEHDACGNYSLFWRTRDLEAVLKELRLSKSIFFMKWLSHSQKVLQKRRILQLYLSIWFFREHGNKLEKQILLKIYTLSWRVRLSFHTRRNGVPQAQIYQGWKEFVKDNGLRRGDIVLFVFNVNVICFELHIFHALKN